MRDITEIKDTLDKIDLKMLYNLYQFRCLTIKQVYNNFYASENYSLNKFVDTKLHDLLKHQLIEEVIFNTDNIALFLTKLGIDIIKEEFDLPSEIFDKEKKQIIRGYYRAGELKMQARLIPHQIYLNQFVLDFQRIYEFKNLKQDWKYYDEKYASQYINIRPDGLLRMPKTDFFLEMDMGTETTKQLKDKWKHYRMFLSSPEYKHSNRKIIVLFIVENVSNIENRKNIVKLTSSEILLDSFDEKFDIIIGTKEELLKRIFQSDIINNFDSKKDSIKNILTQNYKFQIYDGEKVKDKLGNINFDFYIRKRDDNGQFITENGRIQEYLVDNFVPDDLSFIHKISYYNKYNLKYKYFMQREISYIIIANDLKKLQKEIKLYGLDKEKNIFYSTIERITKLPFHKALFQFDINNGIFSFRNNGLTLRYYEDSPIN